MKFHVDPSTAAALPALLPEPPHARSCATRPSVQRTAWHGVLGLLLAAGLVAGTSTTASAQVTARSEAEARAVQKKLRPDTSGQKRRGEASYYHASFSGRKMADGTRFDPRANHAASKTLPLGTRARVTNLENGRSAIVEIRDRGPYAEGRIVDVSPAIARQLDMHDAGIAPVEVAPISVPLPDGSVKPGVAARQARAGFVRTGSR